MTVVRSVDIAVIGNGVLGLSVALEVARRAPEMRVALIGPPGREGAATAAAGAMHNCFGEVTKYTAGHAASRARFALARRALDSWPAWRDMLADAAGAQAGASLRDSYTTGTFVVLGSGSGRITGENFDAMRAAVAQYDEPHEDIAPESIEGLAPSMDARPLRALYLRREGAVDARGVLSALEAAARTQRVRFLSTTVRGVTAAGDAVRGVQLADGDELAAGAVVLAAGSMSGDLASGVLPPGAVPPMLHGTGLALLTRRHAPAGARHVIRTPNRAASCGVHVVPLPGAVQYIGATSVLTTRPPHGPELGVALDLMRAACTQVDRTLASSQVTQWLCGRRPVPLDCFPLIGPCSVNGLLFATGTYRDGFHCSPAIARHLADHLLHTGVADDLFTWFAPERLPIQTMTVQEAIAEAVDHGLDGAYEHDLRMPAFLGNSPITAHLHERISRGYEGMTHPVALPPEVMISEFVIPYRDSAEPGRNAWLRTYLRAAYLHHT
ncbi:NAD(P)/FAD-dependent oxidoreductase [Streptomyces sp. NPDC003027]